MQAVPVQPVGGWQTEEFVNDWRAQQPPRVHHAPDPTHMLNNGNNRDLAATFQARLNAYRSGLEQNQYLMKRRRNAEERENARNAERTHMMEELHIAPDNQAEYERQALLAAHLRARQRRVDHPPQHLTPAQKRRNLEARMYPRIIKTETWDEKLHDDNDETGILGDPYPVGDRTAKYDDYLGKTLKTLDYEDRQDVQRTFGEMVGLLGYAPEFHPELLTKASAKEYLRDQQEERYRFELYDMDDDYRTPGTLWIYKRGDEANNIPEEIFAVGGFIVGKTATSKTTTNMLRDIDYYRTHPTRELRKQENKRDWSIDNDYVKMKPVPGLFKYVSGVITNALAAAGRKIPTVGGCTYIVFHDLQTKLPIYSIVCKVTTITFNAIISRITELFLMYYIYPKLQMGTQFDQVRLMVPPPPGADSKVYLYNTWMQNVIHAGVEKKLLNLKGVVAQVQTLVDNFNFAGPEHWFNVPYMGAVNQPAIIDALTSVAVLYFTNSPLRFINNGAVSNEDAFINSNMIFRFCTEHEYAHDIVPQIQSGASFEYALTSKATKKVYEARHVQVKGNNFVEREDLRWNFQAAPVNNINNNGGGAPPPDDDSDSDNRPVPRAVNNINAALPAGREVYSGTQRAQAREQLMHYSTPRAGVQSSAPSQQARDEARTGAMQKTRKKGKKSKQVQAPVLAPIVAQVQQTQPQDEEEIDFVPGRD